MFERDVLAGELVEKSLQRAEVDLLALLGAMVAVEEHFGLDDFYGVAVDVVEDMRLRHEGPQGAEERTVQDADESSHAEPHGPVGVHAADRERDEADPDQDEDGYRGRDSDEHRTDQPRFGGVLLRFRERVDDLERDFLLDRVDRARCRRLGAAHAVHRCILVVEPQARGGPERPTELAARRPVTETPEELLGRALIVVIDARDPVTRADVGNRNHFANRRVVLVHQLLPDARARSIASRYDTFWITT